MKKIPIFFTFDNNYVEPAAVAFFSLLNKAKSDVFYEMFVMHSDITEEKQNLLKKIIAEKGNAELTFINTGGFMKEYWDNKGFSGSHCNTLFTSDTVLRCFGSKFLPQYDKIIYSDVDVVFVDDISELNDMDITDKYILGVKNPFMRYSEHELSHLKPEHYEMLKDKYICGGIWVMNLKKIREDNLEEKMTEIIKDETIIKRWNDQDIINIACEGKVGFIPLNYISYPYMNELLKIREFVSHYSREELYDSLINPKIIHYAAEKPWNGHPNYSVVWHTIFDYLGPKKTSVFKSVQTKAEKDAETYKAKSMKYKRLFNTMIIISAILLICLTGLIIATKCN